MSLDRCSRCFVCTLQDGRCWHCDAKGAPTIIGDQVATQFLAIGDDVRRLEREALDALLAWEKSTTASTVGLTLAARRLDEALRYQRELADSLNSRQRPQAKEQP